MSIHFEQKPEAMIVEMKPQIPLSFEERQRLVGAFAWLIQEDKKQNPELYQLKNRD